MKTYTTVSDFLQDKSFVKWVLNPDSPPSPYWEKIANENGILISQARLILLELDLPGKDWEVQDQMELLSKIHQCIQTKNLHYPTAYKKANTNTSPYWKKVSFFLFLIFFSFMAFLAFDIIHTDKEEEVDIVEIEYHWITKSNPKGQKSKIHLPDGSIVIINADSEIKFKSDFGVTNREIFITGESFFEVAPDSLLPFRVYSEDLITTALGTSFNINSYDPEHIRIQLATGKVGVSSDLPASESVYLKPGEELIAYGSQKLKKRKFNLKKAFSWKSGVLLFENASLSEFRLTLERWYGVEIELINSPVFRLNISGEFKDTYLSDVLESIGYAYGFDYKIDQKKVKLVFTPN